METACFKPNFTNCSIAQVPERYKNFQCFFALFRTIFPFSPVSIPDRESIKASIISTFLRSLVFSLSQNAIPAYLPAGGGEICRIGNQLPFSGFSAENPGRKRSGRGLIFSGIGIFCFLRFSVRDVHVPCDADGIVRGDGLYLLLQGGDGLLRVHVEARHHVKAQFLCLGV